MDIKLSTAPGAQPVSHRFGRLARGKVISVTVLSVGSRPIPQTTRTGVRVTLPVETLDAKLASLPEGVSVSRDRIEVRFNGAKEAVGRLYSLAHALVNDYERFEELVDGGEVVGGGGEVSE